MSFSVYVLLAVVFLRISSAAEWARCMPSQSINCFIHDPKQIDQPIMTSSGVIIDGANRKLGRFGVTRVEKFESNTTHLVPADGKDNATVISGIHTVSNVRVSHSAMRDATTPDHFGTSPPLAHLMKTIPCAAIHPAASCDGDAASTHYSVIKVESVIQQGVWSDELGLYRGAQLFRPGFTVMVTAQREGHNARDQSQDAHDSSENGHDDAYHSLFAKPTRAEFARYVLQEMTGKLLISEHPIIHTISCSSLLSNRVLSEPNSVIDAAIQHMLCGNVTNADIMVAHWPRSVLPSSLLCNNDINRITAAVTPLHIYWDDMEGAVDAEKSPDALVSDILSDVGDALTSRWQLFHLIVQRSPRSDATLSCAEDLANLGAQQNIAVEKDHCLHHSLDVKFVNKKQELHEVETTQHQSSAQNDVVDGATVSTTQIDSSMCRISRYLHQNRPGLANVHITLRCLDTTSPQQNNSAIVPQHRYYFIREYIPAHCKATTFVKPVGFGVAVSANNSIILHGHINAAEQGRVNELHSIDKPHVIDELHFQYSVACNLMPAEEFPPDAQRGVLFAGGEAVVCRSKHTNALLLSGYTPPCKVLFAPAVVLEYHTPDFSMPFNVMTLATTAAAIIVGGMLNTLARKPKK